MKNKLINGFFYIIMGILLAVGPYTLFHVCDTSEKVMKCWWSVRAETAIGGLLIFAGILILLLKSKEIRFAINLNTIGTGVVAILIPSKLIGGCAKETMLCRSLTFPSIYIISVAVIVFSIGNMIYLKKKQGREQDEQ